MATATTTVMNSNGILRLVNASTELPTGSEAHNSSRFLLYIQEIHARRGPIAASSGATHAFKGILGANSDSLFLYYNYLSIADHHLILSDSSMSTPPGASIFEQLQNLQNVPLIAILAVCSVCFLTIIGAIIFTHRRKAHMEDQKQQDEFKKRKWIRRQSSRYSIDLDRFVADIVGPDGEIKVSQKAQELKIPMRPNARQMPIQKQSNQTLNPLAVSIIDLLAKNYQ